MKKHRQQAKEVVRRRFLGRMPKGGLMVEIGVWKGEFSGTLLDLLEPETLVLIDPWEHIEEDSHAEALAGRAGAKKMDRIHQKVADLYSSEIASGQVRIERGYSVPVLTKFADESINFAYVDGDHSYDGVRADLEILFPKMKFAAFRHQGRGAQAVVIAVSAAVLFPVDNFLNEFTLRLLVFFFWKDNRRSRFFFHCQSFQNI